MPAPEIVIRLLTPADTAAFCALRLRAILDSPSSFSSSREDELARTPEEHVQRIADGPLHRAFGAFDGERLVGFAGLRRESMRQLSHKALLWGVFVDVAQRGKGVARRLVNACIAQAEADPAVMQVHLSVNAENNAALGLYESLGFIAYGTEPRSMRVGELFYDEHHLALLIR
ncbi:MULTISPECIES: GNAT family N-acetyltransferase [unclassified Janthinobacterium]|uniref:GNAT family N-acetyltransferase n=1 Tax=unclassified Janthinobacterium TaxID=2610881 RepID=UPI000C170CE6|nr:MULTISPECIES: GNAT family N-acetyltransferase [unclassified Janthinobacterium]MDN2671924.1 GNAT family N-acetyltransferase [Janthinobacterium sp. SUN026]MDN2700760.1 GNAT family N-acetyltransferase [Janthinobacterium sp. SUN100]MDO8047333.1 GNAT family N-acetyltransferase [Janthinobacterium sp. SUN211]MED5612678.1 GNAT family N-acetyltransferase [Janthinobacterium sp. P210005]PIF13437.1 RimJ/RimL family protein N-acetyltransferase [Janthinobacterium sp. 13]